MSLTYAAIQWSAHKRRYDLVIGLACVLFLAGFFVTGKLLWTGEAAISDEILLIRALGTTAIVLLHVILAIGPLARLSPRFLPILFNRRHLGVLTFLLGLAHAALATGYYHGFGAINPLRSLLISNTSFDSLTGFPFQLLGLLALLVLFALAATSHDFWLRNLTARHWKRLHMLAYAAYALLVGHVALGTLQTDRSPIAAGLVLLGLVTLTALHIAAGLRERRAERTLRRALAEPGWMDVGLVCDIPEDRARTVSTPAGERIAVFRHAGAVSAIANVCAHQGGPLGEGRVIDGCITCPWHGWQYRAHDGCAPPPFKEQLPTYQVRIVGQRVLVSTATRPPGQALPPANIPDAERSDV